MMDRLKLLIEVSGHIFIVSRQPTRESGFSISFGRNIGTTHRGTLQYRRHLSEFFYRKDPLRDMSFEKGSVTIQKVEQSLIDWDQVLRKLKDHLKKARQQMKNQADKHRKDVEHIQVLSP